ncbi:hypothetical protein H9P43_005453 [Blastocladiella emersonii ATCC 22665]|nr:hypothetical protein H9P43_005453 [Blastocladiella emersonii ATCC 22665]
MSTTTAATAKPASIGFEALAADRRPHEELIVAMERMEFTFLVAPLDGRRAPGETLDLAKVSLDELREPLEHDVLRVQSSDFAGVTVGTVEHGFDAAVVNDHEMRLKANLHLRRLFNWAGHAGVSAVQLPLPTSPSAIPEFARAVQSASSLIPFATIWVRVSVSDPAHWTAWNLVRSLVGHSAKYHVALEVGASLPAHGWTRWHAEPVAALVLPTDAFLTNRKGCPVLSKRHQALVREFLPREPYLFVTPTVPVGAAATAEAGEVDLTMHGQYLAYLHRTQPAPSVREKFADGYADYLQAPLQPLADHLEAQTYEVFEKCGFKYAQYQAAVAQCLRDRTSGSATPAQQIIMVVGAGPRGPLVDCCLRASAEAKVPVRVYAVEKNPNALVPLRHKQRTEWGKDRVTVVYADMRTWQAPEKCDILVSELLGSFADNELSPECLDGVQHVLKADGVSIPQSYSPWLAPVSSAKLYSEAAKHKTVAALETSYVVMIRNAALVAPPQRAWTFHHPAPTILLDNAHNERYASLAFDVQGDSALVHGFAGYFDCTLYRDVTLSTRPGDDHSPDMTSWFPIYFPIRHPVFVPRGAKIDVHVWRVAGNHKVWYEWAVVPRVPATVHGEEEEKERVELETAAGFASLIHNVGGKSHAIGL